MLVAVAAASPQTTRRSLTKNWAKTPVRMVRRKSTPAILAVRFGANVAVDCVICDPPVMAIPPGTTGPRFRKHASEVAHRERACDEMRQLRMRHTMRGRTAVQP